jgi:asparagine N-glycosylation enzyme membrane subunit Stt3
MKIIVIFFCVAFFLLWFFVFFFSKSLLAKKKPYQLLVLGCSAFGFYAASLNPPLAPIQRMGARVRSGELNWC